MKMTGQWTHFSIWWNKSVKPRLGPPIAGQLTAGEAAILFVLMVLLAVLPFITSRGEQIDAILSDILLAVYSLGAAVLLLLAARAASKQAASQANDQERAFRVSNAWQVMGLGMLLNSLGRFLWLVISWQGRETFPSMADVFYLSSYPVIVAGIFLLPIKRRSKMESLIRILEIAVISLCAGLLIWNFLAKPLSDAMMVTNRLEMIFTLAYPLFDVLLLVAILALIFRPIEMTLSSTQLLLGAGFVMWIVSDIALISQEITASTALGSVADGGYVVSYIFWGLAGICQFYSVREGVFARRRSTKPGIAKEGKTVLTLRAMIPPVVLFVTYLILWKGLNNTLPMSLAQLLVWMGVLLVLTSWIQLLYLYNDKSILQGLRKTNAELERRVAERTRTLSNMTEALRLSEANYRAVIEDTPVMVCTFLEDGTLSFVNQAYAAYYGSTPDGLVGKSFYSMISPNERPAIEKKIQSLNRDNTVVIQEYPLTAPNGEVRWQRWINRIVTDGDSIKYQAIGEDITESVLAEARLRESEERYRILFETMSQGVVYQDDQGKVISANPAALRILGMTAEQMLEHRSNEPLWSSIHEDGSNFPYKEHPTQVALRTGKDVKNVVMGVINPQDGVRHWINVQAFPQILRGENHATRVYTTFEDITERKQGEQSLQLVNSQLSRGVEELSLLARLDELLQLCQSDQEAYQAIHTIISRIFSSERGTIYTAEPDGMYLARVMWGDPDDANSMLLDQCLALRHGRPYFIEDTQHGLVCEHMLPQVPVSSYCVPMIAQNEIYGTLHIEVDLGNGKQGGLDESRRKLAVMVSSSIALALSNIRLRDRLRDQAVRDPLTSLFNRRFMEESLTRELLRVERSNKPLGVLMMDIDHFKNYNDTYGHEAGDLLLVEVAKLIRSRIRGSDIACRYGGEEIVVVLPEAASKVVLDRAEKLRLEISQLRLTYQDQVLEPVTVSVGVVMCPEGGQSPQGLLRRADQALYAAKQAGRNRVLQWVFNRD